MTTFEKIRLKALEKGAEKIVTGGQMVEMLHFTLSALAEMDLYDVAVLLNDYRDTGPRRGKR